MKLALNMIMKNESTVLERLLLSVLPIVDTYYILDTGSTDNSIELVKNFFDKHGIKGEIHVNTECVEIIDGKTCFIYDKARNEAIKLLTGKADYGFWIDCDEELILSPDFNLQKFKEKLSQYDTGSIVVNGAVQYGRRCLFKISKPFYWTGKIHEVLVCHEGITSCDLEGLSVTLHADETDSNIDKYKQHALVLQKQVDETGSPRDIFYLANSYKDAGEWRKAIEYYRKRVDNVDGFYEERYYSQFMLGNLTWANNPVFALTLVEFLKASELDTLRAEHIYNAIIILQQNNLWQTAYLFSKDAVERFHKKNPYPNRVLFLAEDVYEKGLFDLHITNCQKLGIIDGLKAFPDNASIDDLLKTIPSGWKENRVFANWLVNKINPNMTVELGVDYGYSLICLAENNKGKVVGIDNFKGDDFTGHRNTMDSVNKTVKWLSEKNKLKNIKITHGDIGMICSNWNKNHKIDILHIDALATYDAVKGYFESWSKYLTDKSVILIHDSTVHEGVRKFFSEITLPKVELKTFAGLGVISKNHKIIDEITSLFVKKVEPVVLHQELKTVEREKIAIAYIDHNKEVYSKYLEPSMKNLEGDFDMYFTDDKNTPAVNYNKILESTKTKYILYVHQDVTFGTNFYENIFKTIDQVPDFGAIGIVGHTDSKYSWATIDKINQVEMLDCCCILINKEHGLKFDEKTFDDFHLYVEDYCMQLKAIGKKCYTILTDASEAGKEDVYEQKENYAKHHSVTVNKKGYAWGRYWEYWEKLQNKWKKKEQTEIDICIISFAKTPELYDVTCKGLDTLLTSETDIKFNIFVVESNKIVDYNNYPNTKTIHPDIPFNYNAYLNLAIKEGKAPYCFLANNDLVYEKDWATAIITQMELNPNLMSVSPFCPQVQPESMKSVCPVYGYELRKHFNGWAIFQRRKVYDIIGEINTSVNFWFSDNILICQLESKGLKHALITDSVVNHHEYNLGVSGETILNNKEKEEMMMGQYKKFEEAKLKIYAK